MKPITIMIFLLAAATFLFIGCAGADKSNRYENGKPKWKDKGGIREEYYESGKLEAKGPCEKGIKNGEWQEFEEESGAVEAKGLYKAGAKDGIWQGLYPSGKIRSTTVWSGRNKNGPFVTFHESGATNSIVMLTNRKETGKFLQFFENGKPNTVGQYTNGLKMGEWITYEAKGGLKEKGEIVTDSKRMSYKNGPWEFYKNGVLSGKAVMEMNYTNGEYSGFYSNGQLETKVKFVSNNKTGPETAYFADGAKKFEGNWENGLRSGEWKFYSPKGYLLEKGPFMNGQKNGAFETYYPDASVRSKGVYEAGKQKGNWVYYEEGGKTKQMELNWTGATKRGRMKFYKEGKIWLDFETQVVMDDREFFGGNKDSIRYFGEIKKGEKLPNIKKTTDEGVNLDILKGDYMVYEDGKLKMRGAYNMLGKNGSWEFYDPPGSRKPLKTENYKNGDKVEAK
jgi:antitoxin component YwqK of YwqJK toxin-antitoxin module